MAASGPGEIRSAWDQGANRKLSFAAEKRRRISFTALSYRRSFVTRLSCARSWRSLDLHPTSCVYPRMTVAQLSGVDGGKRTPTQRETRHLVRSWETLVA